ncbi:transglutaminase superfamily protein [Flavobacteriaceae bacterium MAR_2010_72]|nr:transglutaminase superfamily protein [Flavobacteriaceae bacterium MAR_2010_72]
MFKQVLSLSLFGLLSLFGYSQSEDFFKVNTIPLELKANANAVIRYSAVDIEIKAYNKMLYTENRIVTILNKEGDVDHGAVFGYDDNTNIKKLEVKVYDAFGGDIKRIKKNDFMDVSAVDGGTLYSDSRVKYLNYTPINYPYTIHLEAEIEYTSTAFIPGWLPLEGFYASTQNSYYKITNSSGINLKVKTTNFDKYNIEKHSDYYYSSKNLISIKPEAYSPEFRTYGPSLKAALTEFNMEGVKGVNNTWEDFGKWMHDKLLVGTEEIPESVKAEVRALTANLDNDLEKAKRIYNYVQEKTRYISVQVGIGGWKPMLASDVNRLGYADCKGLSNYTKALLKEAGVEAHYAVIYGDRGIKNIDTNFSSTQGNHVVLCIPNNGEDVWLECTSQTNPFGYIAGWTDDRDAILITPEGGKIVHTKTYTVDENLKQTSAFIKMNRDGSITGEVDLKSYGYIYGLREWIQNLPARDQDIQLKKYWRYINNLSIDQMKFTKDKDKIEFIENVKLSAKNYATKSGPRLLFQPNVLNRISDIPTRYKDRSLDFEVERGITEKDEFLIELDTNLELEAMPNDILIETKYGTYSFALIQKENNTILYKRTYILNKGYYPKEEYEAFREFKMNVAKHDKTKIVLITKT